MAHARTVVVLVWSVMGCAATDGGLFSNLRDRLRGEKRDTAEVAASPAAPAAKSNEIIQTATNLSNAPVGEVAESIVARVNGDVILAQDVFTPIRAQLAKAHQEMPAQQFAQYRNALVQKQLRDLIERQLLIQEAKKHIPEMGIKRLEAHADREFGKRIEQEMKRMEVNTESELRRKMLENGESLEQIRDFQRGTFVAQQFLQIQLQPRLEISREEMVEYYNSHRDQFRKEGGVVWREILVTNEKYGSREAARQKAVEIVNRLRGGADFAEVAKNESEGATAANGGRWDFTTPKSFIVASVDDAIFSLPIGKISDPIEGPNGWHIVRVDEKHNGQETSFVDAQDEIRRELRVQKITKESQRYVQQLMRKAHITTVFDAPKEPQLPNTATGN